MRSTRPEIQEGTVEPTENEQQAETASADTSEANDLEPMVEEELLVEEISIDGMCGVY